MNTTIKPKTSLPSEPQVRSSERLDGDEILEALKECEYALKVAIEKDKIGWLQQVAHQTACDALNNHLAGKKAKPSNDKVCGGGDKEKA
jgi:hypothetical protein